MQGSVRQAEARARASRAQLGEGPAVRQVLLRVPGRQALTDVFQQLEQRGNDRTILSISQTRKLRHSGDTYIAPVCKATPRRAEMQTQQREASLVRPGGATAAAKRLPGMRPESRGEELPRAWEGSRPPGEGALE